MSISEDPLNGVTIKVEEGREPIMGVTLGIRSSLSLTEILFPH